jgi:hypothetical protein
MMNKNNLKVVLLLVLPVLALVLLAFVRPPLGVRHIQIGSFSPAERREYKGMDTKVVVEVKHTPSFFGRPFSKGIVEGGGSDGTYLVDGAGRKYSWRGVVTSFGMRGNNMLVTYPIPLSIVPKSAGRVTFVSKFVHDHEWKALPISVVVRPQ